MSNLALNNFSEQFEALGSIATLQPIDDFDVSYGLLGLEQLVARFETQLRNWRSQSGPALKNVFAAWEEVISGEPEDEILEALEPNLNELDRHLNLLLGQYSSPIQDRPEAQRLVADVMSLTGAHGRYGRKLLDRLEDARVAQHNFLADQYYGALAFRSKFEAGAKEVRSFEDPNDLESYLRSLG